MDSSFSMDKARIHCQTREQANPFLSLCVTYLTAAAVCISVFIFSQSREAVSLELSKLNWTAPTLGLAVVALEVGYILTYRAGWKINTASLVTNIALAILLLFIGFLFPSLIVIFGPKPGQL